MKAAIRSKYGIPGDLTVKEVATPTPKENEVLVRVYASSVNRTDCHVLSGRPFMMRLFTGLLKPRLSIIGTDFAGQIEAVGSAVQSFRVGERVMGFGGVFGASSHAQYFTMPEAKAIKTMASIPDALT